jgi:hypothetical protein
VTFGLVLVFVAVQGVTPSRTRASMCDGLLMALEHIPPDKPGYAKVMEQAQKYCGEELDRAALVALYHSTDGDNWTENDGWLSPDVPHCSWYGVSCDATGRVFELNLYGNQLSGAIPAELGNLLNLRTLQVWDNQLNGTIPPELGNLINLEWLDLWINQLSGSIPPELGNLASLEYLQLGYNQLSGTIPAELGNLSNLEWLFLSGNQVCWPAALRPTVCGGTWDLDIV